MILELIFGVSLFIGLFCIRPYIRFYVSKQRNTTILFYPIKGWVGVMQKSQITHDDPLGAIKQILKDNPKVELIQTTTTSGKSINILLSAKYLKGILNEGNDFFQKTQALAFMQLNLLKGLLFSEGELWKKQRKMLSQLFHYDQLKSKIPIISKIADENLNTVLNNPDFLQKNGALAFSEKISGETILATFFGPEFVNLSIDGQSITKAVTTVIASQSNLSRTFKTMIKKRLHILDYFFYSTEEINCLRSINQIKVFLKEKIQTIVKGKTLKDLQEYPQNVTDIYTKQYLEGQASGLQIDFDEIIHQFFTFFIAGTDTTGHLIASSLIMLADQPQYQDLLLQEIQDKIGEKHCSLLDIAQLKSLKQMDGFINETLRVYGPIPRCAYREAKQDYNLCGLKVQKGDLVMPFLYGPMQNPDIFNDPLRFDPSRWSKENQIFTQDPFNFCPFSAGPRNCIGQHLALIEAKIVLITIMRRCKIIKSDQMNTKSMQFRFVYELSDFKGITLEAKMNLE